MGWLWVVPVVVVVLIVIALLAWRPFRAFSREVQFERARELFGADYATVQPQSGSQANAAVFMLSDASRWITGQALIMDGACPWI